VLKRLHFILVGCVGAWRYPDSDRVV